jgi:signal transduction histidine kinase
MAGYFVTEALFIVGFTGVGAIVLSREPENRIGLLLLFPALLPLSGGLNAMIAWADQRDLPTGWADGLLAAISSATFFEGLVALLLLLIPTGQPPGRRWQAVVVLVTIATAVSFAQSFLQGMLPHSALPPLPLSATWAPMIDVPPVIGFVNEFIIRAGVAAGVASVVYRLVTAQGQERAQVAWILFGASLGMLTTAFPGVFLSIFVPGPAASRSNLEFFIPLGVLAVVVTCGIAILHHDLVQLNPLLRRMLTILVAAMALTSGYLGLRTWLGDGPVAAALTAMGMALVSPLLYRLLRGAMTWLVYGKRGSPAAAPMGLLGRYAATQMIRGIAGAADPDQVLSVLADAIHRTIPGTVDVVLTSDGRELRRVSRGGPQPHDALRERVPLIFQRNELGWVQVSGAVRVTPADRALLGDLASAAAAPLAAAHRSAELQRAHRELITAREQERRRIARDLHDGVGPVLSGLGFALDALRARITDPDLNLAARNARGLVREALQLVRRVSRELRPVGLDQLGLAGSVQELGARYTGPGLTVTVDAEELGELCAATEVAAYAITAEALTNVARHAHATRCEVTLQRGPEAVEITVNDNGTGLINATIGIGSTSMLERARELGGWCHISTGAAGGARVHARLPNNLPHDSAPADPHPGPGQCE